MLKIILVLNYTLFISPGLAHSSGLTFVCEILKNVTQIDMCSRSVSVSLLSLSGEKVVWVSVLCVHVQLLLYEREVVSICTDKIDY